MTFFEFLDALGEGRYRSVVEEHAMPTPFPEAFHHALLDLLRAYYFVGGMPEAVAHYAANRDVAAVRADSNRHSSLYFRWFNEIPVLFLLVIVVLTVVKPL